jgi:acyl-CoA synthetase (AMP-forming)/AMP-acid ligase II
MAVWSYLEVTCERFGHREAVVHGEERWSYQTLRRRSLGLANQLWELGVGRGDRVVLLWENSAAFLQAYFAVQRLGAVLVALNPVCEASYLDRVLRDCSPLALIGQSKRLRRLTTGSSPQHLPPICLVDSQTELPGGPRPVLLENRELDSLDLPLPGPEDDALILYTSGTTGAPKGVTLTQRNLMANTDSIVEYLGLDEHERVLVVLPFYYSYGHSVLLTHVAAGGCLVIDNRFAYPNTVLDTLAAERVTGFPGVASTFSILMTRSTLARRRFPHLRYFTIAGGALPPARLQLLRGMLPGVTPVVMYGQTEGTARLSYLSPEDLDRKLGSIGRGIPGVRLEVLDEDGHPVPPGVTGEIVASGQNIMRGYWNDPQETAKVLDTRGRLWTGDLAHVDEEGFIFVVGRKKDMIKSAAFRICPKEIEDLVSEVPGVVVCAIVGLPDEILGEKMVACIVRENGVPDENAVMRFLRPRLPHWKLPQELRFMVDLPRTSSGKVKKHVLKERLGCGGEVLSQTPKAVGSDTSPSWSPVARRRWSSTAPGIRGTPGRR